MAKMSTFCPGQRIARICHLLRIFGEFSLDMFTMGNPGMKVFAALKAAVSNAWYSLSYDEVANLMAGMGLRCLDAAEVGYKHIGR